MKWFNGYRIRLVLVGIVALIVFRGGRASAEIIMSEPTCVDRVINNGINTQECSFLHDGLKLYFTNNMPGGHGGHDIWVASRDAQNAPWKEPIILGPSVNSGSPCYPAISPNELELYFHTSWNSTVLMRSTRISRDDPWNTPELFTGLGNNACDLDISADGLTVYFASDRAGGYGSFDIWMATRETLDAPWFEPVNLGPNINDSRSQYSPSISNDELTIFYNNGGLHHISVAKRPTKGDLWAPPVLLGSSVNNHGWVHGAEISPDGSVLYFDSNRSGGFNNENFWQVKFTPLVDFNGDGIVDIDDLVILIEHWGEEDSSFDIGPLPLGDGIVDKADLAVLMSHWGQEAFDSSMIAYWKLDETQGSTARDSVSGEDALVLGDPLWLPTDGMFDGALQFDGVDDLISAPTVLNPTDGPFSVFAWIKDGAPGKVIIAQQVISDWLSLDAEGNLMTDIKCVGRSTAPLLSEATITDGQWHRVGLVWDGSSRTLIVDDIVVAEDMQSTMESSDRGLYIGVGKDFSADSFFSGLIDDVRIYSRAVSP